MVSFKKKCAVCNKNYVLATNKSRYVICYECQKKEMQGNIDDPEMKEMFDIPEELYQQNQFLRNIKINYLKYGSLTEKQIETFKRVAKELAEQKSS